MIKKRIEYMKQGFIGYGNLAKAVHLGLKMRKSLIFIIMID